MIVPGEGEDGVLWAGVAPAALFKSEDDGRSWQLNQGLWDEPSRPEWQPGAGGMCMHSICTWPGDAGPDGRGDLGGRCLAHRRRRGEFFAGAATRASPPGTFPKRPGRGRSTCASRTCTVLPFSPRPLYMQFHGGVYRSDDAGESWSGIGSDRGLPSDFGFPMVIDPNGSRCRPTSSRSPRTRTGSPPRAGSGCTRPATAVARGKPSAKVGLPQDDAYLTDPAPGLLPRRTAAAGALFRRESGEVFGSADGGATWTTVAGHLPTIASVRAS